MPLILLLLLLLHLFATFSFSSLLLCFFFFFFSFLFSSSLLSSSSVFIFYFFFANCLRPDMTSVLDNGLKTHYLLTCLVFRRNYALRVEHNLVVREPGSVQQGRTLSGEVFTGRWCDLCPLATPWWQSTFLPSSEPK